MLKAPLGNVHLVDKQASLIIFLTGGKNCYIPLLMEYLILLFTFSLWLTQWQNPLMREGEVL